MSATVSSPPLTNTQLQILKLYAYELNVEELNALKRLLAAFFAEKIQNRSGKIWKERGYNQETMLSWLNEEGQ
jgi:hypothetical protein